LANSFTKARALIIPSGIRFGGIFDTPLIYVVESKYPIGHAKVWAFFMENNNYFFGMLTGKR
jgi:hypothetical protein